MTVPNLGYVSFLDLAAKLGCVGVEVRNDIARPLFDDLDPVEIAAQFRTRKGYNLIPKRFSEPEGMADIGITINANVLPIMPHSPPIAAGALQA